MTKQQLNMRKDDDVQDVITQPASDQSNGSDGDSSSDGDGSSGVDPESAPPATGSDGGQGDGSSSRMFSQEDVSRMMAREKQQGRNAAFNELGIDPSDSNTMNLIKTILEAQKQQQDPPVAPSQELLDAQHRADIAEAKAEAMMLGASPQYVDDIVTLATAKLDVAGETDFKAVLESLKTKYPVWFGVKDDDSDKPGHKGTGSSLPAHSGNSHGGSGEMSLGQRLAAAKHPKRTAKSYWNN